MIAKQDILDRSAEWQLRLGVVEKDYVLGWLLAALAEHPETSQQWVFKGGTCLKKCFFETYRFSEDLDFSLLPGARYSAGELASILGEVAKRASDLSGIGFPADSIVVRERPNGTFEARLAYRGPLADPSMPRVRFDLTRHEPVLDGIARRPIFHAYPDQVPPGLTVPTYSINELFAEKVRALVERTRPRDLYDVVFVLENRPEDLDLDRVRELFREKCGVKNIAAPDSGSLITLIRAAVELASEWANMLGHQLPSLPPLDSLLARVDGLFGWIDQPAAVPAVALPAVRVAANHPLVVAAGLRYWGGGVALEAVRFAGSNRLLVEFMYHGTLRRAEPYSLRRAQTGSILLYAWESGSTHIKAFNVEEISMLRATTAPFTPRYRVEFAASGPMEVAPLPARSPSASRITGSHRSSGAYGYPRRAGPIYVYECTYCGRRFDHSKRDPTLRSHKDRGGYGKCPGRRGTLVDTKYS
jgi:predicted nucleotidyltransferase component of viral defense system